MDDMILPNTEFNREKLKDIDEVAYVRFASVYRQFQDIQTFMDELNTQPYAHLNEGYMVVVKMNNEIDATDALISYLKKRIEMVH